MTTGVGAGERLAVNASRSCESIGGLAGPGRGGGMGLSYIFLSFIDKGSCPYNNKCMERGRPTKSPGVRLSMALRLRLTEDELRKVCTAAKKAGLSVSEYMRKKVFAR